MAHVVGAGADVFVQPVSDLIGCAWATTASTNRSLPAQLRRISEPKAASGCS